MNDQKEYAFDPANLVLNICEIYINLSKNENFTLAVSQDGRSYSPELFKLADNVLGKRFCFFFTFYLQFIYDRRGRDKKCNLKKRIYVTQFVSVV